MMMPAADARAHRDVNHVPVAAPCSVIDAPPTRRSWRRSPAPPGLPSCSRGSRAQRHVVPARQVRRICDHAVAASIGPGAETPAPASARTSTPASGRRGTRRLDHARDHRFRALASQRRHARIAAHRCRRRRRSARGSSCRRGRCRRKASAAHASPSSARRAARHRRAARTSARRGPTTSPRACRAPASRASRRRSANAVERALDGAAQRGGRRVLEDKAGACAQSAASHGVVQPARAPHKRHRAVAQRDQLPQPARLVPRRHQEAVAAAVDALPERRVEVEPELHLLRMLRLELLQRPVQRLVARAEDRRAAHRVPRAARRTPRRPDRCPSARTAA